MDTSRRSALDRALKKPRLSDASDRQFPRDPRLRGGGGGGRNQSPDPRIRPIEREKEDAATARPAAVSYAELVSQYETALAELRFNSKPVITNLTIIAGENQHAAKGIASVICTNILEVPTEQKLPSLYLLDSIVKNIGKDYIKCFAARLPQVFCKAYKQVDSSTRPGMRHLFGTWKGVFPSAILQLIEKELGFPPIINGSSRATASKPESQTTQPPSPSIHVNPKYLEARQRLQPSRKEKDTSSDDTSGVVTTDYDADMFDRTAITASTRQWTELPFKMHNVQRLQREQLNDSIHEKKRYRDVRDHEFSPEFPWQSSDRIVGGISEKVNERDRLNKPFYGATGTSSEVPTRRRNDFDVDHAYGSCRPSGSVPTDRQLPLLNLNTTNISGRPTPKNWMNSEEEEYMWDDMDPSLTDYEGGSSTVKGGWGNDDLDKPASLQRGQWIPEHLDSQWNNFDTSLFRKAPGGEERLPLFRDIEENVPEPHVKPEHDPRINIETTEDPFSQGRSVSGHHAASVLPSREIPPSMVGLDQTRSRISGQSEGQLIPRSSGFSTSSALPRPGPLSQNNTSTGGPFAGPIGMFGQQRLQPLQPPSPSAQSPQSSVSIQHPRSHSSIDHDHLSSNSLSQMGQKLKQLPGQVNTAPQAPVVQDYFPVLPQSHTQQSCTSLDSEPPSQKLQTTSASLPHTRHHLPFSQPLQPDLTRQIQSQFQPLIQNNKPPLSVGTQHTQGFSGTDLSSSPDDVSGQSSTSNLLAAIMKSGLFSNNPTSSFQNKNVPPPLPSGPPPIQVLTSSTPLITPSSASFPNSHGKAPAPMPLPVTTVLPPLPPGPPPPSSLVATIAEVPITASASPNPFYGLLSSLLSKGIISSPSTELPTATSAQLPSELLNQSSGFTSTAPTPVSSTSDTSTIPPSLKEPTISESSASTTTIELENLIGLDFRPEIIREFHPLLIDSLFDELMPQCNICGLRFKLREQLHNHLNWHDSKKSETNSSERLSRKWFADISNWAVGNVGPPCGPSGSAAIFPEEIESHGKRCEEPMVPADESQSICALCGEPFEDFYSDERDEWMYKGTLYLNLAHRLGDMRSNDESTRPGPIVHAKCVSNSVAETDATEHNKQGLIDS